MLKIIFNIKTDKDIEIPEDEVGFERVALYLEAMAKEIREGNDKGDGWNLFDKEDIKNKC